MHSFILQDLFQVYSSRDLFVRMDVVKDVCSRDSFRLFLHVGLENGVAVYALKVTIEQHPI
jgi:hypothetical protein